MSSIDKDMQSIASGYDRRVRVRNSSVTKGYNGCEGKITFYIGSECILTIQDRYGYIHESEKAQIRNAILRYQERERTEMARQEVRRREEEARRREEEARRRAEEARRREAERVAAHRRLVAAATAAKRSVESSYVTVKQSAEELQRQTEKTVSSLSAAKFDISGVKARLDEILQKQKSGLRKATEERARKLADIARFENVPASLSTDVYRRQQQELSSISPLLTSASFDREEVVQAGEYVRQLLSVHDKLIEQREQFRKMLQLGGKAGEIARIALAQIESVDKTSVEQIERALTRLQDTKKEVERARDEATFLRIGEELKNAPAVSQVSEKIVLRRSSYEYIDYSKQCEEAAETLRHAYDVIAHKENSTATREETETIEQALQRLSLGMAGKNLLDDLRTANDLVRCIHEDDEANREVFEEYARLKQDLEGLGVQVEPLDVFHYDAQRERLLHELYERRAATETEQEKEEAADKRSMLSLGVRSAFSEQGLYFVTGRLSDGERAEELVFAIPGVDDVVIKAVVTEDSLHWYACGTKKEDGSVVSAERVLEVMRVFDKSEKPQKILNSLSQALNVRQAEITGAADSESEGALETIVENGVFALTEELRTADGSVTTAGEVMRRISAEFSNEAERNRSLYAVGVRQGTTQINEKSKNDLGAVDVQALRKRAEKMRKGDTSYARQPKQRPQNRQRQRLRYMRHA